MACGSYCSRCGVVYDYNVKDCPICGGELFFNENGKESFLFCKKGCLPKKYWKMSRRIYLKEKKQDYESNGLIYNWIHKK